MGDKNNQDTPSRLRRPLWVEPGIKIEYIDESEVKNIEDIDDIFNYTGSVCIGSVPVTIRRRVKQENEEAEEDEPVPSSSRAAFNNVGERTVVPSPCQPSTSRVRDTNNQSGTRDSLPVITTPVLPRDNTDTDSATSSLSHDTSPSERATSSGRKTSSSNRAKSSSLETLKSCYNSSKNNEQDRNIFSLLTSLGTTTSIDSGRSNVRDSPPPITSKSRDVAETACIGAVTRVPPTAPGPEGTLPSTDPAPTAPGPEGTLPSTDPASGTDGPSPGPAPAPDTDVTGSSIQAAPDPAPDPSPVPASPRPDPEHTPDSDNEPLTPITDQAPDSDLGFEKIATASVRSLEQDATISVPGPKSGSTVDESVTAPGNDASRSEPKSGPGPEPTPGPSLTAPGPSLTAPGPGPEPSPGLEESVSAFDPSPEHHLSTSDPVTSDPAPDPVTSDPAPDPVTSDPTPDPVTSDPVPDPDTEDDISDADTIICDLDTLETEPINRPDTPMDEEEVREDREENAGTDVNGRENKTDNRNAKETRASDLSLLKEAARGFKQPAVRLNRCDVPPETDDPGFSPRAFEVVAESLLRSRSSRMGSSGSRSTSQSEGEGHEDPPNSQPRLTRSESGNQGNSYHGNQARSFSSSAAKPSAEVTSEKGKTRERQQPSRTQRSQKDSSTSVSSVESNKRTVSKPGTSSSKVQEKSSNKKALSSLLRYRVDISKAVKKLKETPGGEKPAATATNSNKTQEETPKQDSVPEKTNSANTSSSYTPIVISDSSSKVSSKCESVPKLKTVSEKTNGHPIKVYSTQTSKSSKEKESGEASYKQKFTDSSISKRNKQNNSSNCENAYMCKTCHKTFVTKSGLKIHETSHYVAKPYKCNICPRAFKEQSTLSEHKSVCHPDPGSENLLTTHKCGHCCRVYRDRESFMNHLKRQHGDVGRKGRKPAHTCKICGHVSHSQTDHQKHMDTHKGETKSSSSAAEPSGEVTSEKGKTQQPSRTQRSRKDSSTSISSVESDKSEEEGDAEASQSNNDEADSVSVSQESDGDTDDYLPPVPYRQTGTSERRGSKRKARDDDNDSEDEGGKKVRVGANELRGLLSMDIGKGREHCCSQCDKTFHTRGHLTSHINNMHGERDATPRKRPREDKEDKDVTTSKRTRRNSSNSTVSTTSSAGGIKKSKTSKTLSRNQCSVCRKGFSTEHNMKRHMAIKHSNKKPYKCKHCGRRFPVKEYLSTHIKTNRPCQRMNTSNVDSEEESEPAVSENDSSDDSQPSKGQQKVKDKYQCRKCPKRFARYSVMELHLESVHRIKKRSESPSPPPKPTKTYKCHQCGESFKSDAVRRCHVKNKHSKRPTFDCDLCDEKFSMETALVAHRVASHSKRYGVGRLMHTSQGLAVVNGENMENNNDENTDPETDEISRAFGDVSSTLRLNPRSLSPDDVTSETLTRMTEHAMARLEVIRSGMQGEEDIEQNQASPAGPDSPPEINGDNTHVE